jgi:hypothetical protein
MSKGYIFLCWMFLCCGCGTSGVDDPILKKISQKQALEEFQTFRSILKSSHPSLHLYSSEKKLNFLMDSIENTLTKDQSLSDLYNKYFFITNEIGCSHTLLNLPEDTYDSLLNMPFFFPFPVKLIDSKLLVNATDQSLTEGTEIMTINGTAVKDILQKIARYEAVEGFHRPTQSKLAAESFALNYFLVFGKRSMFNLASRDTSGKEIFTTVYPITLNEWNDTRDGKVYYYDRTACDYDLSINEERKYALMRIATFEFNGSERQSAFENFCSNSFELLHLRKDINNLVIDMRENLGGSLYNSSLLFSYLSKEEFKEFEYAESKIRAIEQAEYLDKSFLTGEKETINTKLTKEFSSLSPRRYFRMADSMIERWSPQQHSFKGNIFVITNSTVCSAASYFSVMVKNSGRGKIIGEETAGGSYSGNGFTNLGYILPYSKIKLVFPYVHLVYSYKEKKNRGTGLIPDFEVPDSYESFRKNVDRQLLFIRDSLIGKIQTK